MSLRFALFYHSLVSDWNHGNAHFLRGIAAELVARGHRVTVYEARDGWSRSNLIASHGLNPIDRFRQQYPALQSEEYTLSTLQLDRVLQSNDVAIVHEWNDPDLVSAVAAHRRQNSDLRVFFHDTHHRVVTAPAAMEKLRLSDFDGVLAYGASLKNAYERLGWSSRVHVWHEAADVRTFYPRKNSRQEGEVVFIGNWGDEERSEELREFLIDPVHRLGLAAAVYGVRYPAEAIQQLSAAGIDYRGWVPNFDVPAVFGAFKVTIHVPRSPYTRALPGIPTIRPFEALACGIPLISAPWSDCEGLFRVGQDFLMVKNGAGMKAALRDVLCDDALSSSLASSGLETILKRHTCAHRVDEFLHIYETVKPHPILAQAAV